MYDIRYRSPKRENGCFMIQCPYVATQLRDETTSAKVAEKQRRGERSSAKISKKQRRYISVEHDFPGAGVLGGIHIRSESGKIRDLESLGIPWFVPGKLAALHSEL